MLNMTDYPCRRKQVFSNNSESYPSKLLENLVEMSPCSNKQVLALIYILDLCKITNQLNLLGIDFDWFVSNQVVDWEEQIATIPLYGSTSYNYIHSESGTSQWQPRRLEALKCAASSDPEENSNPPDVRQSKHVGSS